MSTLFLFGIQAPRPRICTQPGLEALSPVPQRHRHISPTCGCMTTAPLAPAADAILHIWRQAQEGRPLGEAGLVWFFLLHERHAATMQRAAYCAHGFSTGSPPRRWPRPWNALLLARGGSAAARRLMGSTGLVLEVTMWHEWVKGLTHTHAHAPQEGGGVGGGYTCGMRCTPGV
jgi:hypothetical protein